MQMQLRRVAATPIVEGAGRASANFTCMAGSMACMDGLLRDLGTEVASLAEREALPSIDQCVAVGTEPLSPRRRHALEAFSGLRLDDMASAPCCMPSWRSRPDDPATLPAHRPGPCRFRLRRTGDARRGTTLRGGRRSLAGVLGTCAAPPRPCALRHDPGGIVPGARIAISEDRGPLARGCRLDAHEMARAIALVSDTLRERPQLLMLNKFGKAEAEGGGFRPLIAAALEQGVPVLIAVPLRNLDAWRNFAGGWGRRSASMTRMPGSTASAPGCPPRKARTHDGRGRPGG